MPVRSRLSLIAGLPLFLCGCAALDDLFAGGDLPPPVFRCAGSEYTYILHQAGDGSLALEIAGPARGTVGVSTWLMDWEDQRVGMVTGQEGGHQHHLRLAASAGSYILYEGINGELTDDPGRTYAGVIFWASKGSADSGERTECDADAVNARLVETVQQGRANAGLAPLKDEVASGPFDGWF